jgi:hypothetical protein
MQGLVSHSWTQVSVCMLPIANTPFIYLRPRTYTSLSLFHNPGSHFAATICKPLNLFMQGLMSHSCVLGFCVYAPLCNRLTAQCNTLCLSWPHNATVLPHIATTKLIYAWFHVCLQIESFPFSYFASKPPPLSFPIVLRVSSLQFPFHYTLMI